ncbi:TPA: hypothetical protein OLX48_000989 [Clostridioides difficile]|nr:hypothetical protein [Clostridioides difficile]HCQ5645428.1 hypothetical protein [Clostridioides difficile]HCQ5763759.1 hypothetical protein [Clostridioides difficile]HCQ6120234.1 hypothetical protein [Clostridioides difficile]
MSMIKIENLTFSYPTSYDNVFENVSFQVDTDWKLGFVGRNGRGDSDIMMTDTINPLKSKFKGFHKTFKQDDLGLSLSSFLLN